MCLNNEFRWKTHLSIGIIFYFEKSVDRIHIWEFVKRTNQTPENQTRIAQNEKSNLIWANR